MLVEVRSKIAVLTPQLYSNAVELCAVACYCTLLLLQLDFPVYLHD
jgi:hypothetical protein